MVWQVKKKAQISGSHFAGKTFWNTTLYKKVRWPIVIYIFSLAFLKSSLPNKQIGNYCSCTFIQESDHLGAVFLGHSKYLYFYTYAQLHLRNLIPFNFIFRWDHRTSINHGRWVLWCILGSWNAFWASASLACVFSSNQCILFMHFNQTNSTPYSKIKKNTWVKITSGLKSFGTYFGDWKQNWLQYSKLIQCGKNSESRDNYTYCISNCTKIKYI